MLLASQVDALAIFTLTVAVVGALTGVMSLAWAIVSHRSAGVRVAVDFVPGLAQPRGFWRSTSSGPSPARWGTAWRACRRSASRCAIRVASPLELFPSRCMSGCSRTRASRCPSVLRYRTPSTCRTVRPGSSTRKTPSPSHPRSSQSGPTARRETSASPSNLGQARWCVRRVFRWLVQSTCSSPLQQQGPELALTAGRAIPDSRNGRVLGPRADRVDKGSCWKV